MKEFTLSLLILFNLGVLILVSYNMGRETCIKAGIEYVNDNYVTTYRDTVPARLPKDSMVVYKVDSVVVYKMK